MSDNKPTPGPWQSMERGRVVQKLSGSVVAECLWQADADYITALANGDAVSNPYAADNVKLKALYDRLKVQLSNVEQSLAVERDTHVQAKLTLDEALADNVKLNQRVTAGEVAVQERERIIGRLRADSEKQARYGQPPTAPQEVPVTPPVEEKPRQKGKSQ